MRTTANAAPKSAPKDVDDYLANVPEDKRAMLEKVRAAIKAAAPKATETLTYGVPTYKLNGSLVSFGAAKDHCALYVMNGTSLASFTDELKDYSLAKGTIRFTADKPLPATLIKKIVKARVAEDEARAAKQKPAVKPAAKSTTKSAPKTARKK